MAVSPLLALLPFSGANGQDAAERFASARERWQSAGISVYRYAYRKRCECYPGEPPETVVSVADGRIVDVRYRRDPDLADIPVDADRQQWFWTVDDLFSMIETAIDRQATLRVSYDRALGHPVSVYVDHDPVSIGDEVDIRLTEFLPGEPG